MVVYDEYDVSSIVTVKVCVGLSVLLVSVYEDR